MMDLDPFLKFNTGVVADPVQLRQHLIDYMRRTHPGFVGLVRDNEGDFFLVVDTWVTHPNDIAPNWYDDARRILGGYTSIDWIRAQRLEIEKPSGFATIWRRESLTWNEASNYAHQRSQDIVWNVGAGGYGYMKCRKCGSHLASSGDVGYCFEPPDLVRFVDTHASCKPVPESEPEPESKGDDEDVWAKAVEIGKSIPECIEVRKFADVPYFILDIRTHSGLRDDYPGIWKKLSTAFVESRDWTWNRAQVPRREKNTLLWKRRSAEPDPLPPPLPDHRWGKKDEITDGRWRYLNARNEIETPAIGTTVPVDQPTGDGCGLFRPIADDPYVIHREQLTKPTPGLKTKVRAILKPLHEAAVARNHRTPDEARRSGLRLELAAEHAIVEICDLLDDLPPGKPFDDEPGVEPCISPRIKLTKKIKAERGCSLREALIEADAQLAPLPKPPTLTHYADLGWDDGDD